MDNTELAEIFSQDQKDREKWQEINDGNIEELKKKDDVRRRRVQQLLELGAIKTGRDYFNAAIVFQHGRIPEDYLKACELAKKATELGEEGGKKLSAAAHDRYLLRSGGSFQKFGTQYKKVGGKWKLEPVDPSTTDEERARYNILPLADLIAKENEMNS